MMPTDILADARIDFHGPCCCWHAGDDHLITGGCTRCSCRQFTADDPLGVLTVEPHVPDIHAAPEGGNSLLCEHYLLMQRMIIEGQAKLNAELLAIVVPQTKLIADLQRRLNGEPVTTVFIQATR